VITASPQAERVDNVHHVADSVRDANGSGFAWQVERIARKVLIPGEPGLMWSRAAAAKAYEVLEEVDNAVVYSTSPPLAVHLAALQLKYRRRIKWIADFRDPLYGNPFRRQHGMPARVDRAMERAIFRRADIIIANTDTAAARMRERYPMRAAAVHHIWNGFDPGEMLGAAEIPARQHKVITHAGSLYGARHPGGIIASLARLLNSGHVQPSQVKLQLIGFIGEGCIRDQQTFDTLIAAGMIDFIPRNLPRPEAQHALATADGLLLLDLNEFGADLQVPAKLFEYLQIGRPVLAWTARNSPSERILAQSGLEHCSVSPDDTPERIDEQVVKFLSLPTDPKPMSDWAHSQFDASIQTARLCRLIEQAAGQAL
jgi:glycosyltransferase involved in cell wall biosynthesis